MAESTKYRIDLGNCGDRLDTDVTGITEPTESIKWDSTAIRFDSTIITFDRT